MNKEVISQLVVKCLPLKDKDNKPYGYRKDGEHFEKIIFDWDDPYSKNINHPSEIHPDERVTDIHDISYSNVQNQLSLFHKGNYKEYPQFKPFEVIFGFEPMDKDPEIYTMHRAVVNKDLDLVVYRSITYVNKWKLSYHDEILKMEGIVDYIKYQIELKNGNIKV